MLVYGKEVIFGWSTKEAEALPCPCAGPKVWLGFPSKALLP